MTPSPFIVEWAQRIARERGPSTTVGTGADRRALDVASGAGRHALALAQAGFKVFGVDVRLDALRAARAAALQAGVGVELWCADLTQHPLPRARFDLIVVCRYLQRDLFPALAAAVVPGGAVIYETFTTHQRALGRPPTSPDHLLEPGELRRRFAGFDVLFYEEVLEPDAVARVVARSRS
jgi:SAM-dependent methyltransferase